MMENSSHGGWGYPVVHEIKRLRRTYDPRLWGSSIRVIFLGESPPLRAPRVFFYSRKGLLYRATLRAFKSVFSFDDDEFLVFFARCGCFLYDFLGDIPGLKLSKGSKQVGYNRQVEDARRRLRELLEDVKPYTVIVVVKRVYRVVEKDLRWGRERGVVGSFFSLPFPTRKYYDFYVKELSRILHELRGLLCNLHA
ncbi:MAG: hypothetical protein QXO64_09235 [Thermofilaceae archaeon]